MVLEKAAALKEINPSKHVSIRGKELALFKVDGKIYCVSNICTHVGGPLSDGDINKTIVTCPWHFAQFDITTGKLISGPAMKDVKSYAVKIDGDDVYVDID